MERYFDAHLYLANWGTRRIMLRLPRAVLDPETVERFCVGDSAASWVTRTHVILDLRSEDEEGRLAAIVPVRAELASGDRRLLNLAWLLCVQNRELNGEEPEPSVPAGLAKLSGPLRALADFLRLDPDLLDAAAAASRPLNEKEPSAVDLRRWVESLPTADKDEVLLRVDCRAAKRSGRAGVEFSWEGSDEGDEVSGRGWAAITDDGALDGRIFFHNGDDSGFRAMRVDGALDAGLMPDDDASGSG